jgi:hypothetical protein
LAENVWIASIIVKLEQKPPLQTPFAQLDHLGSIIVNESISVAADRHPAGPSQVALALINLESVHMQVEPGTNGTRKGLDNIGYVGGMVQCFHEDLLNEGIDLSIRRQSPCHMISSLWRIFWETVQAQRRASQVPNPVFLMRSHYVLFSVAHQWTRVAIFGPQ